MLVTGASGGVGSAAVQMASAMGCRVIAVTTSPSKVEYLKSLGASDVIVAGSGPDTASFFKNTVIKQLGGVDMAFEAVGGASCWSCLSPASRAIMWSSAFRHVIM